MVSPLKTAVLLGLLMTVAIPDVAGAETPGVPTDVDLEEYGGPCYYIDTTRVPPTIHEVPC